MSESTHPESSNPYESVLPGLPDKKYFMENEEDIMGAFYFEIAKTYWAQEDIADIKDAMSPAVKCMTNEEKLKLSFALEEEDFFEEADKLWGWEHSSARVDESGTVLSTIGHINEVVELFDREKNLGLLESVETSLCEIITGARYYEDADQNGNASLSWNHYAGDTEDKLYDERTRRNDLAMLGQEQPTLFAS
jgi:hypothetical protein